MRAINVSKAVKSQDEFILVMKSVGQNLDLAKEMVRHESTVRDLNIPVAASNLYRRKSITNDLGSLILLLREIAK